MKLLPKYETMTIYRVIEEQILFEGLSYTNASEIGMIRTATTIRKLSLYKYKTMNKYRVIEEQILEEGLSYNDAIIVMEMFNEQGRVVRIEKYDLPVRLGRDPDLH
tara:strand:- start:58 stop:375 length:318 start_codon:yes stop_codon:yes gene_type:complete